MTDDFYRHASAQMAFMATVQRHRPALAVAVRADPAASVRTLVRLARSRPYTHRVALHDFETAIRASLTAYVAATPKAARHVLEPDAQFLVEHFDRFTEVPITASPIKRVVSWARRTFRGATQDAGDVD